MNRPDVRILHIITGLKTGGAERVLQHLMRHLPAERCSSDVISLTDVGPVGREMLAEGYKVSALGMRSGLPNPLTILKLAARIREIQPDIVQTWLPHADLIGGLASKKAGVDKLIWNVRGSDRDPNSVKWSTRMTILACAKLSKRLPAKILCVSNRSMQVYDSLGFDARKMMVIPNGVDIDRFKADAAAADSIRQELHLLPEASLIGYIARFNPQKDHQTFLQAAGSVARQRSDVHFLLAGDGINDQNQVLRDWIGEAGLQERVHLLGRRDDIPRINAALDIACLTSSYGEGFPNIVIEAMACETPCVVTDAGDACEIVGDTGFCVPIKRPDLFAKALLEMLTMPGKARAALGEAARQRVAAEYQLSRMVQRYAEFYHSLIR